MSLLDVVARVVAVVAGLHLLSVPLFVGAAPLRTARRTVPRTLREVAAPLGALAALLAVNGTVRRIGVELSWVIGLNITGAIYAVEGTFVAAVQSLATPLATSYFAFVYVFGYVYLLTFPLLASLLRGEVPALRQLLVAYGVNYGLGLCCYVLFVAYGPRNLMPELVESLLYTSWPGVQALTSEVNVNTNVFPSLHASLSVTVALLAYRRRAREPAWAAVAAGLAASIVVSTMYLGIHWATDVLVGVALAAVSVAAAERVDERAERGGRAAAAERAERRTRG